jgi:UDP-GlcNAc3NAcA epimerase
LILTIIGNRPQLIKSALISKELKLRNLKETIVYTYQHFDDEMYTSICKELDIKINNNKLVNKTPKSLQDYINNIQVQIKKIKHISVVIVYGDTHSTLAGSLFAKQHNIKLIHIEAGERSFNNQMPEEINRIAVDYLADILVCVNKKSSNNLKSFSKGKIVKVVGDIMLDTLFFYKDIKPFSTTFFEDNILKKPYIYFTLHRQSNTVDIATINEILLMIGNLNIPVIYPMHPRVFNKIKELNIPSIVKVTKPFTYLESVQVLKNATYVITDSGGLQKEAYWLQKKCITLRNDTEWSETLIGNWNTLYTGKNSKDLLRILAIKPSLKKWDIKQFGNGKATNKIVNVIMKSCIK